MEAKAIAKYLRISPSKVRPLLKPLRQVPVEAALSTLAYSPRKGARFLEKTIKSAVANLRGKGKVADERIYLKEIFADGGPLNPPFKYRPRARGMASRIRNRTCHITVVVEERPEEPSVPPALKKKKAAPRTKKSSGKGRS
jgi:large subunit ribosomal protein L22